MQGKRLWITAPYEVTVQPFDLPDEPGPGRALLEIERTLISAGTELAIVMGTHINFTQGGAWPRYPMALGYTAVGRVLKVGEGVTEVEPGQRVLSGAPHATHALVEARTLLPVVPACTPEDALLANLSSIPQVGLRLAEPRFGEGVIVFGQGLIGALAARLAKVAGLNPVIGVDPIAERREIAASAGIVPVNPDEVSPAVVHQGLADGRLPEIVIEATGAPPVINEALKAVAEAGRVVLMGSPRGKLEIDPYTDVHRRGISIIGAHARFAAQVATPWNAFTADRQRRLAMSFILAGALSTTNLISHHIRPEEALETYRALANRAPSYLGVIIDWTD